MKITNKKLYILIMITLSIVILGGSQVIFATVDCSPGGTLSSGVYTCSSNLSTENPTTVVAGSSVIISASGTITLSPGFTASAGSTCDIFAGTMDSDNDGLLDSWETTQFGDFDQDETTDYDNDGLPDIWEFIMGSNPKVSTVDSDDDGIPDWYEIQEESNLDWDEEDGNCACD